MSIAEGTSNTKSKRKVLLSVASVGLVVVLLFAVWLSVKLSAKTEPISGSTVSSAEEAGNLIPNSTVVNQTWGDTKVWISYSVGPSPDEKEHKLFKSSPTKCFYASSDTMKIVAFDPENNSCNPTKVPVIKAPKSAVESATRYVEAMVRQLNASVSNTTTRDVSFAITSFAMNNMDYIEFPSNIVAPSKDLVIFYLPLKKVEPAELSVVGSTRKAGASCIAVTAATGEPTKVDSKDSC